MTTTEDVRKCAAGPGIVEEAAPAKGMEEKAKKFMEQGAKVCTKA